MTDGSENAIVGWLLNFRIRMFVKSAEKKSQPFSRILSTFKRSFSKKMGKTPNSHIIHLLGGDYC